MRRTVWLLPCLMAALAVVGVARRSAQTAEKADKNKKAIRKAKANGAPAGKIAPPSVLKRRPNATTREPADLAYELDAGIDAALDAANVPASAPADDAEFLRRVTLDVIGRVPTKERAHKFLDDQDPAKREKLVDELLADDEYGEHFASLWYRLLIVANDDNKQLIGHSFEEWLAKQFNANKGWNEIVFAILTASGVRSEHPEVIFYLSHVEGAKDRALKPAQLASEASRRFLGVQYQCAECHNHPFTTTFKQTDFWSIAAFFGKTEAIHVDRKENKTGEADPGVREKLGGATQIDIPESKLKPVPAKFPDGKQAPANANASLREAFAKWCVNPANKTFAKAAVNRLWSHFFGRGIVQPVDDFRADNPPSNPVLLDELAAEFERSNFDLKHLVRCIVATRAYQRSSDATPENRLDTTLLSHMAVKQMGPEQLFDSLTTVLGAPAASDKKERKVKGTKKAGNPKSQFLKLFDTAEEADFSVDYTQGIPQALQLMNGTANKGDNAAVKRLMSMAKDDGDVVEGLYLQVLSRRPTAAEAARGKVYVTAAASRPKGFADLQWALLNSSEFMLNH